MNDNSRARSSFALPLLAFASMAAALTVAVPAHASGTSSASLGNLSITVVDLDPTDQVAPSLYLNGVAGPLTYVTNFAAATQWDPVSRTMAGPRETTYGDGTAAQLASAQGGYSLANAQYDAGQYHASGLLDVGAGSPDTSYSAEASIRDGDYAVPLLDILGSGVLPSDHYAKIGLGPNTRLIITADASAQADMEYTCIGCLEYHRSVAFIRLSSAMLSPLVSDELDALVSDDGLAPGQGTGNSGSGQLRVTFDNTTASAMQLHLWAGASASASARAAAPIPEPSTWAMVGIGVAGAVWAGRRRMR